MKQKDLAIVACIVVLGAIFAVVITKFLFGGEKAIQKYEVVYPISSNFPRPDKRYFNDQGTYNPTQLIRIGQDQNNEPFQAKPQ